MSPPEPTAPDRVDGPTRLAWLAGGVVAAALLLVFLLRTGQPAGQHFLFEHAVDRLTTEDANLFEFDSRGLWLHPSPGLLWASGALFLGISLVAGRLGRGRGGVLRGALLGLLAVLVWAVSLELLRLAEPRAAFSQCTSVSWRLKPDLPLPPPRPRQPPIDGVPAFRFHDTLFSNSVGLREREIPFQKAPGEFRILCLGHSWTFGWGVAAEEAWPRRLEVLLQQRHPGRRFVVVNAAMPGSTPMQAFLMMERLGLLYQPDLVIVGGLHEGVDLPAMDELRGGTTLLGRSVAWSVLRDTVQLARSSGPPSGPGAKWYAARLDALWSEHGIPALAFGVPSAPPPHPLPNPRFMVGDFAFENHLGFKPRPGLAVVRILVPRGVEADRFLIRNEPWTDSPHPSVPGHETIARGVAEALHALPEAQDWLGRR